MTTDAPSSTTKARRPRAVAVRVLAASMAAVGVALLLALFPVTAALEQQALDEQSRMAVVSADVLAIADGSKQGYMAVTVELPGGRTTQVGVSTGTPIGEQLPVRADTSDPLTATRWRAVTDEAPFNSSLVPVTLTLFVVGMGLMFAAAAILANPRR